MASSEARCDRRDLSGKMIGEQFLHLLYLLPELKDFLAHSLRVRNSREE